MLALPPLSPERAPHTRPSGALVVAVSVGASGAVGAARAGGTGEFVGAFEVAGARGVIEAETGAGEFSGAEGAEGVGAMRTSPPSGRTTAWATSEAGTRVGQ